MPDTTTSPLRPTPSPRTWCIVVRGVLALAAFAGACTIEEDPERVAEFRTAVEDGCGAGRIYDFGVQTCTYAPAHPLTRPDLLNATCNGDGIVECTFALDCTWAVTSTGDCRSEAPECPMPPSSPIVSTKSVKLPPGDVLCDPQDDEGIWSLCSNRGFEMTAPMQKECQRRAPAPSEDIYGMCCIDADAPCAPGDVLCEAGDDSIGGEDSDDDGGVSEPCPPGATLVCGDDSPLCVCAIAD